jgi:hypothetical protein
MRALSVKQPWADLIAAGEKTVEVRTWPTNYRGEIVIHASSRPAAGMAEEATGMPLGALVCTVEIIDCRPLEMGDVDAALLPEDWQPNECKGMFAWVLQNPREVVEVPMKGKPNLWNIDEALVEHV